MLFRKQLLFTIVIIIVAIIAFAMLIQGTLLQTPTKRKQVVNETAPTQKLEKKEAQNPTQVAKTKEKPMQTVTPYILHERIYATMFWIGEKATDANDYIPNTTSAWDQNWLEHYGGIDNPYARNGYHPKSFTPHENPFYIALPYNDFDDVGRRGNAIAIPWYDPNVSESNSLVKNRWVKLTYNGTTCYAQWEDVGPFKLNDFDYVFLGKKPKAQRAGIDLSPAVRDCLHMVTNDYISWQFVDENSVPNGPWKQIVTTSSVNW